MSMVRPTLVNAAASYSRGWSRQESSCLFQSLFTLMALPLTARVKKAVACSNHCFPWWYCHWQQGSHWSLSCFILCFEAWLDQPTYWEIGDAKGEAERAKAAIALMMSSMWNSFNNRRAPENRGAIVGRYQSSLPRFMTLNLQTKLRPFPANRSLSSFLNIGVIGESFRWLPATSAFVEDYQLEPNHNPPS